MGNYSVPESIRIHKPKGTMVKRIKNGYYVYNYTSKQIPIFDAGGNKRWKTKTEMGDCIGLITETDGFIPNDGFVSKDEITARNYGDYAFAINSSQETLNRLYAVFHQDDARQIYSAAIIFFVNGFTYMTSMKGVFDLSYLPIVFEKVHLGYDALHALYKNLGTRGKRVHDFESMIVPRLFLFPSDRRSAVNYNRSYNKIISLYVPYSAALFFLSEKAPP